MSDDIRVSTSKLQPDQNSARELLLGREAAGEEKLLRKVTAVMDILWSSFRRGWTSKIPNTKSQRGINQCVPAVSTFVNKMLFLTVWKVAISPVIKTFIRKINLNTDGHIIVEKLFILQL